MLRWPLAMCIMAVHWFSYTGVTVTLGFDPETAHLPVWSAFTSFVKVFLSDNGVASFFFISGFLFFIGAEFSVTRYKTKLRKRVHTLLVPYILWNLLTVIYIAAHYLPIFAEVFPRMHAEGFTMTWGEFFKGMIITTPPHNANLWFIRELMTFVIVSPGIYWLMVKAPRVTVVVMTLLGVAVLPFDNLYLQQLTWAVLFFALGAYLSIQNCDLIQLSRDCVKPSAVLFPVLATLCWLTMGSYPYLAATFKLLSLFPLILLALWVAGWCVTAKNMTADTFLTGATFFVFVFHPWITSHLCMLIARVFKPVNDMSITLSYLGGYFVLIAIVLGVYMLLCKLSPEAVSVLTGRRGKITGTAGHFRRKR